MKKIIGLFLIVLLSAGSVFAAKAEKSKKAKKKKNTFILMKTTMGDMTLMLYNETPKHRDNFIKLTKEGFYDSLLFHRVIASFMIQGGDPQSKNAAAGQGLGNGEVKGVPRIPAEIQSELYHKKGALAAARDNNPEKASSNCQFYIVQGKTFTDEELSRMEKRIAKKYSAEQKEFYRTIGGTPHLDNNYTVFGELVKGFDVLDKIAAVETSGGDRPVKDVRIISVRIDKKFKAKNIEQPMPAVNSDQPQIMIQKSDVLEDKVTLESTDKPVKTKKEKKSKK